jgi:leucyl aminopeptidase
MRFTQTKKLETGTALVFFFDKAAALKKHPFFKLLSAEDQKLLNAFTAKAELKAGALHSVFLPSGRRALVIGRPGPKQWNGRRAILAMRQPVAAARKEGFASLQVSVDDFVTGDAKDPGDLAESLATQAEMANFEFVPYMTKPKEGWRSVQKMFVFSASRKALSGRLRRGKIVGEEINAARALANTPGGDMTPATLAAAAAATGRKHGFKVRILKEDAIRKLRMGGILAVGQGSGTPPRLIIMEHLKGPKGKPPVVLVGKGITFDSGGLNLKPTDHIYEMHMDMSGGGAVIHTMAALARLKARVNVIGLVPAAENMVSGKSYRPGDVVKTMSGKTIEIMNTDAEGRVVLADALGYTARYKPRLVIDVATLTGSAMVALGQRASALFSTERKVEDRLREVGEETGDLVWPMPLWEEFEEEIKGTFGDVANSAKSKYGGAITAAVFLWQFIKGQPWVHLDIAPRMTAVEGEYLSKGSAGAGVALLTRFLEKF